MMKEFHVQSFVGGVILGILLAGAWFLAGSIPTAQTAQTTGTNTASTSIPVSSQSGAISVADQPAGNSATIESITVPPPGVWIAVREMDSGTLGNVLGAVRVGGPRSNVVVPLLRATEPGQQYAVELYRNESDTFSPDMSVYVDFDTGERVVAYFTTTAK